MRYVKELDSQNELSMRDHERATCRFLPSVHTHHISTLITYYKFMNESEDANRQLARAIAVAAVLAPPFHVTTTTRGHGLPVPAETMSALVHVHRGRSLGIATPSSPKKRDD